MRITYKNELYRIIKEEFDLDPLRFTMNDYNESGCHISEITLINSEMKFVFANLPSSWEKFKFRYTPFAPILKLNRWIPDGLDNTHEVSSFSYKIAIETFKKWLQDSAKPFILELDITDKWSEFQFETNIFNLTNAKFGDNQKFSTEQINQIASSIENLKQLIADRFQMTEDQSSFITERLDYIVESSSRLGKFDWSNTFISIIISIAINMGIDTNTGKDFFNLIKKAFEYIFNYLPT